MEFDVQLTPQHLEQLGQTAPLTGLIELVWNALDADSTEVAVEFARNELQGVEEIRVRDNGHGMLAKDAEDLFGALGNSWKREGIKSADGRALHGKRGQGRYRAAGIGPLVIWDTVAEEDREHPGNRFRTRIELRVQDLSRVVVSEPEPTDDSTGTLVIIPNLGTKPPQGLGHQAAMDRLTGTFALALQNYNAHLQYDRDEVDPAKVQTHREDIWIDAEPDKALLTIIEWDRRIDRGLYVCDSHGNPLVSQQPGIQAPGFEFTAYLQWTGFENRSESDLLMLDMDSGEGKRLLEESKEAMRTHFKGRLEARRREQIDRWKEEKTYPFEEEPKSNTERAVREVFDVVALNAGSVVNGSDKKGRRLSLRLIREALERDPGSLHHILEEILDLPEDRREELSALLGTTTLAAMISLSTEVAGRLEFLRGLETLVFEPDIKKVLKERSQLHKILAAEPWIFGEEFAVAVNDETLTTTLDRHLKLIDRESLAPEPVTDAEGKTRVLDLMLARALQQNRDRREHLVVELKAPAVPVGLKEVTQIINYANTVSTDNRFDKVEVQWDFVVVSTRIADVVENMYLSTPNRPPGLASETKLVRVWVKTWSEIIEAANHRMKFAASHLEYQPDAEQALAYLHKTHAKYLPEQMSPASGVDGTKTD